ncbi:hypothetical protein ACF0H5_017245 [Mactra antiquata]
MVVQKSNVMYQCNVFYIGNGRPTEGKKGVEAIQEPLRDRYRGNVSLVEGSDVTVTVMPDVVHVQYANSMEPEFTLPISTLSMCAAVRCVDDASNMKFIPVHSVVNESEPDSDHPAIFVTVMRRSRDLIDPLLCHQFICNSSRDALHLVNATQTAHTALRRGYDANGALKFFMDQSTDFDRTLHISRASTSGRMSQISRTSGYEVSANTGEARTYVTSTSSADNEIRRINRVSRVYSDTNFQDDTDARESTTYYVKSGETHIPAAPVQVQQSETILVKTGSVRAPPVQQAPAMPQQTIIVDKPIIRPQKPVEIPPPKIVERPVYIEGPPPPKVEAQVIYVDKPIMREMKWPEPPRPEVVERPVVIEPPPPPKLQAQKIVVDKPIIKDWPKQPTPPPPIIEENPVYIDPPRWAQPQAQRIIVDKPIVKDPGPPPPAPAPIIEERPVYIDAPEYPKQEPHKIVIEKPVFNPPKPAPMPPAPIIEERKVFIDPPAYPKQDPIRIVVEKPIIQDPGPPPPAPEPIIIEKPVHIDPPRYPQQEPQRIVVEKPIMRDPGPPPPPPKPIIIEKIVYVDPPPWPKVEPQRIVVEKPVFRPRPPPQVPKPIIIEKPVYIDAPAPVVEPQRVVVEKPVLRTTYGVSETRRQPQPVYNLSYRQPATNIRSSYIVRSDGRAPPGLRRYAWSEVGEDRGRSRYEYGSDAGAYRVYGQPRDFREKQFMNERGFSRRINGEYQVRSGSVNGVRDDRRSSVSS